MLRCCRLTVIPLLVAACDSETPVASDAAAAASERPAEGDAAPNPVQEYKLKSMSVEAKAQLAALVDASVAYFNAEHVAPGAMTILPHGCPNDGNPSGSVGPVPGLDVDCSKGPEGRCKAVASPSGPGEYAMAEWRENDVWNGLNFAIEEPHYYHYKFSWENNTEGFGSCSFKVQAFGDLDGDGIFSTYERAYEANEDGGSGGVGLVIDKALE